MKQVLLIKGAPDEINRSIGSWGTLNNGYRGKHEQRDVLENGVNMNKMGLGYLYFQMKLTSWQDNKRNIIFE